MRRLAVILPGLLALLLTSVAAATAQREIFVDRALEVGVDFTYFNGMSGEFYFPEIAGGGAALFDYDRDGDLDLYLVQGGMLGPDKTLADAIIPPPPSHPAGEPFLDRLFRNDLVVGEDGTRTLRFTDVTKESGLVADGYGMGVASADIDNDGWPDLYLTNLGSNQMWRNNGDGTFSDITVSSGTDDNRWSVAASFFDYDADGYLDLYVGNYVDFNFAWQRICNGPTGARDYCSPAAYDPLPDRLFHNEGDGSFVDVTGRSGVSEEFGSALGVVSTDANGDGRIDIYVANDGNPNQLWINQGDGTFVNDALLAGCSVNRQGVPEASMGVDAADFDGDGDEDLFMTHLESETNTLFLNDGSGIYSDVSQESGLGRPSWEYTAFGTRGVDYDNDGLLDLMVANGAVTVVEAQARAGSPYPLHQPNSLFRNLGNGRFEEVTAEAGSTFAIPEVSRGIAFGDLDNDGDTDAVLVNSQGPARVLINTVGQDNAWIGLRLVGQGGRDMLGARVGVFPANGRPLWRRVRTDGSYVSAHDPRVLVGLGAASEAVRVEVRWPDGRTEEWSQLPLREYRTLEHGTGTEISEPR